MNTLPVIAVHGIGVGTGRDRLGFSNELKTLVCNDNLSATFTWDECVWEDLNDAIDKRVGDIVRNLLKSYRLPWKFDAPSRIGKIGQGIGIACANLAMAIGGDFLNMGFDLGSDFVLYLDSDHGQKIRDRLKHQILALAAKHQEGLALVAHSLGSVIAYDVVAQAVCNKHPLPVKQLITFGSPLAWTFELRNDEGKRECAFVSVGNTRWTNFYYEEDYVPIRKPLPETQFPTVENHLLKLPNGEKQFSSHTAYWKDAVFAAEVRKLIEV